jgi:hypothetical protein
MTRYEVSSLLSSQELHTNVNQNDGTKPKQEAAECKQS